MSAKRFFIMLAGVILALAALLAGFNIAIDPFGVFGDRTLDWYSASMTNNPKAAKIGYISQNHEKYNAYIIGASGSSSISPEHLGKYTGHSWYNMFNYGADMAYVEKLTKHLIENAGTDEIFLVLGAIYASQYDMIPEDITYNYHPKIEGGLAGYLRFAFANPRYAASKLDNYIHDSYFQAPYDVFIPDSGVYDKSLRDAEAIGALDAYLERYPEFSAYSGGGITLDYIDECAASLARVKEMCVGSGVKLTVVFPPVLDADISAYDPDTLAEFYERVAGITDFWDFTSSVISGDARYFYDTTHFRNAVGDMLLARIYGDASVYYPDGFGQYVTAENAREAARNALCLPPSDESDYTHPLFAMLYHHLTEGPAQNDEAISVADFRRDMERYYDEGYTTVGLEEIKGYVERGDALPEKPLIITFDDGYMSNYELAFPILEEFGFKAVIFVIGVSVGRDTYKDTDEPITPHFGPEQIRKMQDSGLVSIQSHTYDMHQVEWLDDPCRRGVLRMDGETERDYADAVIADYRRFETEIGQMTGKPVTALAYPYGLSDIYSESLLHSLGISVTFGTVPGDSTLIKGLPQSLYRLHRDS